MFKCVYYQTLIKNSNSYKRNPIVIEPNTLFWVNFYMKKYFLGRWYVCSCRTAKKRFVWPSRLAHSSYQRDAFLETGTAPESILQIQKVIVALCQRGCHILHWPASLTPMICLAWETWVRDSGLWHTSLPYGKWFSLGSRRFKVMKSLPF